MEIKFTGDFSAITSEMHSVLAALTGTPAKAEEASKPAPAPKVRITYTKADAKPAPAPKKEEKPAPAPAPEPEPEEQMHAKAQEAEEAEEDLIGGSAATLDDAVSAATKLISSGQAEKIKAALAAVNTKRVSDLKGDNIQGFLDALEV